MKQTRVLVTGAAGYIGLHVVNALFARGCHVIASDLRASGLPETVEWTDQPIFDGSPDIYDRLGRPDALIHLVWRDGFVHNSPAHMQELSNHIVFLNHMIDAGIPSISVMGSMHEVGYWEGPIRADTPCNPQSQYGIAKNALRQSMLLYANGKRTCFHWLRGFYVYGDDMRGASIFAKLQRAAAAGETSFPFTSGKNLYDFLRVEDLAEQIAAATLQREVSGIINVCSGKPRSLAEQVEEYIRRNHLAITLEYGKYPDRSYDSPGVWGDASDIERILASEASGRLQK